MSTKKTLLPILLNLAHRLRHARHDVFSDRRHENFEGLQYSEAVMREATFSFTAAKQIRTTGAGLAGTCFDQLGGTKRLVDS